MSSNKEAHKHRYRIHPLMCNTNRLC